jgi:hypothetical protein
MNAPPLSPSTPLEYSLFSPSKAAEQQRLAKDWTYIHSFLAAKYPFPSRVPKFEENEETLKALLQLAAWNEKGDEGWTGMCAVEREVVRGMEEEEEEKVSFLLSFDGFGLDWIRLTDLNRKHEKQTPSTTPSSTPFKPPSPPTEPQT